MKIFNYKKYCQKKPEELIDIIKTKYKKEDPFVNKDIYKKYNVGFWLTPEGEYYSGIAGHEDSARDILETPNYIGNTAKNISLQTGLVMARLGSTEASFIMYTEPTIRQKYIINYAMKQYERMLKTVYFEVFYNSKPDDDYVDVYSGRSSRDFMQVPWAKLFPGV